MEKIYSLLSPLLLTRAALLFHACASWGLGGDFAWHLVFTGEDLWIPPHYLMYIGGAGLTLCLILLRQQGQRIPWLALVAYPAFIFMYFNWEHIAGEPHSSVFWTPPRLCYGLTMLYLLYTIYKTEIEKNTLVLTYLKTIVFFVLPLKFLHFVLTPLALFSTHIEFHSVFSILVSVLAILLVCTVYLTLEDENLLLPGILMLGAVGEPFTYFFFDPQNFYGTRSALFFLYFCVFIVLATKRAHSITYSLIAFVVVTQIYLIEYMRSHAFPVTAYLFALAISILFACIYKEIQDALLPKIKPKILALAKRS